ncbi:hypothetical protein [Nostoc sp. MG11]|uniref:hypothetical protein n=1 Tax=Nostoc sp. MG11 TaxID=2721166 RepID=UPI0018678E3D|nr:hypothetical protein [Nostoc sp. MG11]
MVTPHRNQVELPKIKRSTSTWDGKVIEYLLNHPSGKSAINLALEAITSYWLVEALEGKVTQDEFHLACRAAAENLSKKLASIQQMAGLNTIYKLPTINHTLAAPLTAVVTPSPQHPATEINQHDDDDDGDEDWSDFLDEQTQMLANVLGG